MKLFKKSQRDGTAAIEFAILLPLMLIILYGAFEVSRYIMAVRKADTVANDLGFLLSREGCLTKPDTTIGAANCFNNNGVYTGGQQYLQNASDAVIPFLMFPFPYYSDHSYQNAKGQLARYNSQTRVGYVGLPVFSCPAIANRNDGINRGMARIMWSNAYPADNEVDPDIVDNAIQPTFTACQGSDCPIVSCPGGATKAGGPYLSNFVGIEGQANIILPGQSFLETKFVYEYKSVLGDNFPGINAILPHRIQKYSSYAVRSANIGDLNGNGQVDANEIQNAMQYCTDCQSNSVYSGISGGSMSPNGGVEQICVPASALDIEKNASPRTATQQNDLNSGGCKFN